MQKIVIVACAGACTVPKAAFECTQNTQCGQLGVCVPTGYCGFPDPACPTGYRYGEGAREFSGMCVDLSGGGDAGLDASPETVMLGTWAMRTTLPVSRYTLGGVALGKRIYVAGGIAGTTPYADVTIGDVVGGSVSWTPATPMPDVRRNCGVATNGQALFALGGRRSNEGETDEVIAAPIMNDGTLGGWSVTTAMPSAKRGHTVLSSGQYIYVVGGKTGATAAQDVIVATTSGATITEWRQAGLIPKPLANGAAVISGGYFYVIGGCMRNVTGCLADDLVANVYVAPIRLDGTLGSFVETTALPAARWHHAATVTNGRILVFGGDETDIDDSTRVFSAPVQAMGMLGDWREENPLPSGAGGRRVAVVADGHAFSIAARVYSAPFQ